MPLCLAVAPHSHDQRHTMQRKAAASLKNNSCKSDTFACNKHSKAKRSAEADQHGSSYSASVITNKQIFISCMGARGYRIDPDGSLMVPRDAVITTYQSYGYVRLPDGKL